LPDGAVYRHGSEPRALTQTRRRADREQGRARPARKPDSQIGGKVDMKALRQALMVVAVLLVTAAPVFAQAKGPPPSFTTEVFSGAAMGAGFGAGLIIIGAGYGFGRIGSAALEGMARQPEVAGRVQVAMIIIAALLEGATFFALLICLNVGGVALW